MKYPIALGQLLENKLVAELIPITKDKSLKAQTIQSEASLNDHHQYGACFRSDSCFPEIPRFKPKTSNVPKESPNHKPCVLIFKIG